MQVQALGLWPFFLKNLFVLVQRNLKKSRPENLIEDEISNTIMGHIERKHQEHSSRVFIRENTHHILRARDF